MSFLQKHHREELESNGYTAIASLFTDEAMGALDARILVHQELHNRRLSAQGGNDGSISRANEITFTDHLAEADGEIMAFVRRPEFCEISAALLGPDADLYWNQAVYKAGGGTKQFPWHQDDGYMAVLPSPYLTVWLAINDVSVENGCVWVLPGSHARGLAPHADTPFGKSCYSLEASDQGVPVPLKAGSVALFWSLTMHKSGVNTSNSTRKAFVIQYSKAGLRYAHNLEPVPGLTPIIRRGRQTATSG